VSLCDHPSLDEAIKWHLECATQCQGIPAIERARESLLCLPRRRVIDTVALVLISHQIEDSYELTLLFHLLDLLGERSLLGSVVRSACSDPREEVADIGLEWDAYHRSVCSKCLGADVSKYALCEVCFGSLWEDWRAIRVVETRVVPMNMRDISPPWEYAWTYCPGFSMPDGSWKRGDQLLGKGRGE